MDLFNPFENSKPYYGFKKLEIGNYEVFNFRLVRNRWFNPEIADSLKRILLAELEDQIIFLPSYMAINFKDDDKLVEAINNDGIKRFLCFGGVRSEK